MRRVERLHKFSCRESPDFAAQNPKLCGLLDHHRSRRGVTNYDAPSHPGCSLFWFLPGCPLASVFGVDPQGTYPWETLCRFRAIRHYEKCTTDIH